MRDIAGIGLLAEVVINLAKVRELQLAKAVDKADE